MAKVIGISGIARSGKDLFTTVAQDILEKEYKLKTERRALAYELKSDLQELIHNKTGIDVFTEDTALKNIIRPLLVAYGDVMRKTSAGKYWTQKMEKHVAKSKADIFFITDIRYDVYPEDECTWLQYKQAGKLIHVTRYQLSQAPSKRRVTTAKPVKIYEAAPNEHELFNDPKVKKRSDYSFEWEDMSSRYKTKEELLECTYIRDEVKKALTSIGLIAKKNILS
jgi:hypothetical protein